jgi:hypothetical protein
MTWLFDWLLGMSTTSDRPNLQHEDDDDEDDDDEEDEEWER